jgi:hypothetical protein
MNNQQVAHLWASGSKASGKGSNFYFEGDTIFSYGPHFPIARRITEGFYLITERGYSNSTSRHISYTRRAIPSFAKVFSVADRPNASFETIRREKMEQARKLLASIEGKNVFKTYENAKSLSIFCRDAGEMFVWMKRESDLTFEWLPVMDEMNEIIGKAELIAETNREAYEVELAKQQARKEARDEKRRLKYERERELEKMEALELAPLWRNGECNNQWKLRSLSPMLRIKGDKVQTSQGAEVSVEDAKKAFSFIIAKINGGKEWHRNGEICQVGAFSLVSIDAEFVTIGCHKFEVEEVKSFGNLLA